MWRSPLVFTARCWGSFWLSFHKLLTSMVRGCSTTESGFTWCSPRMKIGYPNLIAWIPWITTYHFRLQFSAPFFFESTILFLFLPQSCWLCCLYIKLIIFTKRDKRVLWVSQCTIILRCLRRQTDIIRTIIGSEPCASIRSLFPSWLVFHFVG